MSIIGKGDKEIKDKKMENIDDKQKILLNL